MTKRGKLRHVTFEFRDEIYRALKAESARSGRPMSTIANEALAAYPMSPLQCVTQKGVFAIDLNQTPVAKAIMAQLPITSQVNRWGDEIYFDVPVRMKNTAPTREVAVGDIAYWPDGPSLCIFFGRTPASTANEPRPASDVTIVGHTDAPASLLRSIEEGTSITISR